MALHITKTYRNFDLIEFFDANGQSCSLQESSVATESMIWFGRDRADLAPSNLSRMHLTREQVKELLPYLQKFAESGEIVPHKEVTLRQEDILLQTSWVFPDDEDGNCRATACILQNGEILVHFHDAPDEYQGLVLDRKVDISNFQMDAKRIQNIIMRLPFDLDRRYHPDERALALVYSEPQETSNQQTDDVYLATYWTDKYEKPYRRISAQLLENGEILFVVLNTDNESGVLHFKFDMEYVTATDMLQRAIMHAIKRREYRPDPRTARLVDPNKET